MIDWPLDIGDEEVIIRGICSPFHASASKKKLKADAFEPTPGTDEVSVLRHAIIDANGCKAHAKAIADPASGKTYQGVAALNAGAIRHVGAQISDSRAEFLGHADIKLGVVRPLENDPPSPEDIQRLTAIKRALLKIAKYHPDSDADSDIWSGAPMAPPA